MADQSIEAYDSPERVQRYDADMDLMHPNRHKMVDVALELLPFRADEPLTALELGVGTAYFTRRFLEAFPSARVIGIDGAESMAPMARERLGGLTDRVDIRIGDFRDLAALLGDDEQGDIVFSSYALHHLGRPEKTQVARAALKFLRPGGWFVNADLIVAGTQVAEDRIQEIRARGIVERAAGRDERFRDLASTRAYIDAMQAGEGDQPLTVDEDLAILQEAGFEAQTCYWLEYREAVTGACKPAE